MHNSHMLHEIKARFGNRTDIIIRTFELVTARIEVAAIYINGLNDKALSSGEETIIRDWEQLIETLLSGNTLILVDGLSEAISENTSGGEVRAVTEASTQVAIRGSKESFTESIGTNISLVRRKVKNADLWVETMKIGVLTQTDVSIM